VLHTQTNGFQDAFSFSLSSALLAGTFYTLDFFAFSEGNVPSQIRIGISTSPDTFGTQVFSASPSQLDWEHFTYSFTPAANASFLTVSSGATLDGTTNVDNFTLGVPEPSSVHLLVCCPVLLFRCRKLRTIKSVASSGIR